MLKTLKIRTNDLDVGMYVSALDRPWLETPFFTQGFMIEGPDDLQRLRRYCEFVFVDAHRSGKQSAALRRQTLRRTEPAPPSDKSSKTARAFQLRTFLPVAN